MDLLLCARAFCLCVSLCVSRAQSPEDGVGSPGAGVTQALFESSRSTDPLSLQTHTELQTRQNHVPFTTNGHSLLRPTFGNSFVLTCLFLFDVRTVEQSEAAGEGKLDS